MSLDIGEAFSDGFARTFARNGLLLAVAFVVVALATTVLFQTLQVEFLEAMLEFIQGTSPNEAAISQSEYDRTISDLQDALSETREMSPLALDVPLGVAAAGMLVLAVVSEAVSIVAVRVFASDVTDEIPREVVSEHLAFATANGFVGGVVVSFLVLVGLVLFVVPGIFLAVAFYFLRQEIALKDKNFVDAMADSWRVTKGHRIQVFAIALFLVVVSQLEVIAGGAVGVVSPIARSLVAPVVGGIVGVFGAAVVTRAYVQLDETSDSDDGTHADAESDPYDAPLGPDDIPK